jgi:hypothetical protein
MKRSTSPLTLDECKIQASILFKSLDLKRFGRCPETANIPVELLKRKHALAVIAFEKGFDSWASLKLQIGLIKGGFLNHWFSTYAEAKAYQTASGGFVLPYKKQFFVCEPDYLEALGLSEADARRLDHA